MIRKLIRGMLAAQILSAMTVSLCLLVDNIMIGQFLGEGAMAAYGLSNPILLAIGAIGTLLAAGIQVACSRSLGMGSQEETNAGYSSAVALGLVISVTFAVLVTLFRSPLATLMGAGMEGTLFEDTRDYLVGFSIGAPGSMGALVLVPFLQMAGQSNLLIVAVLAMTVADIGLDLLNVLVFHGGMFGMGLASSLSYYVAMVIAGFYFLSKKCVFRFSRKLVTRRKIGELFRSGIPAGFNMIATVLLVFILNRVLSGFGGENGSAAIAAFTVIQTIGNTANGISTGTGGVSLTLSGIFFNEEDRKGLREVLGSLARYSVVLGLAVGGILVIFAPALVGLFLPTPGETQNMAVLGLRLFAIGLIPCCINNAIKNLYQATGRETLTEVYSMLEGAVFPTVSALIFIAVLGVNGAWLYFGVGEALMLLCCGILIRIRTGKMPWQDGAALLLREGFGGAPEDLMEAEINSLQEVTDVAEKAGAFCRMHGQSARVSYHIQLCIEEMAANTITHGFAMDQKEHHLFIRLLNKKDYWVIRFRDDCGAFDPVHYVPAEGKDGLGIRLVLDIAEKANYTYSMNMNNLALRLPGDV